MSKLLKIAEPLLGAGSSCRQSAKKLAVLVSMVSGLLRPLVQRLSAVPLMLSEPAVIGAHHTTEGAPQIAGALCIQQSDAHARATTFVATQGRTRIAGPGRGQQWGARSC